MENNEFIILDTVYYDNKQAQAINESRYMISYEYEMLQLCAFKLDKYFKLIDKINLFIKPISYKENIEIDSTIMGINISVLDLVGIPYPEVYNIFIEFCNNLMIYVYDIDIYKIFIFNNNLHKINFNMELFKNMHIVNDLFNSLKIHYNHELIAQKKMKYKISNPMWNLYILYEILNINNHI